MNTLIISTFSCTYEEFKNDVTTLFLEEMCKEFVTDYEFVKVNDHKSHLLMNCTDLEKLGADIVCTKDLMFSLNATIGVTNKGDQRSYGGGFRWHF